MGICTYKSTHKNSQTASHTRKGSGEVITVNYANIDQKKIQTQENQDQENLSPTSTYARPEKNEKQKEQKQILYINLNIEGKEEHPQPISDIRINLRRKTGIFNYPNCPIDNEEIEDVDKELGKFEVPFFGIKGQLDPNWRQVQMGNQSELWWYIGEWKNGLMHGQGAAFNQSSAYLLTGLFISGKISTNHCRKIMSNGSYYIGPINQFFEAEGRGEIHYKNGSKYKGGFIGGLPNGTGKLITFEDEFVGNFENGIKKYGTLNQASGTYHGQFENNLKHGFGSYIGKNGHKVNGFFENNKLKDQRQQDLSLKKSVPTQ